MGSTLLTAKRQARVQGPGGFGTFLGFRLEDLRDRAPNPLTPKPYTSHSLSSWLNQVHPAPRKTCGPIL